MGRHDAGPRCDVHVDGELLRFCIGDVLVKTATRHSTDDVVTRAVNVPVHGIRFVEASAGWL